MDDAVNKKTRKALIKGLAGGVVLTLLLGIAGWLIVTYTGLYNVAASDQHADVVRWTLDTTMHRSVANRADDVELPAEFSQALVTEGARHYAHSCAQCHGAPGQDPEDWSLGQRPEPPDLTEEASEWSPQEIYWIAENGIKMTGMPAFGGHLDRQEMVAITAFVTKMPGLSPEEYRAMTGSDETRHGHAAKHE